MEQYAERERPDLGEGERGERLEQEEFGVAGGERLVSVRVAESRERRSSGIVAGMRWISLKEMSSMSLRRRRPRLHWHGAGNNDDGCGGRGASNWMGKGRWRRGLR